MKLVNADFSMNQECDICHCKFLLEQEDVHLSEDGLYLYWMCPICYNINVALKISRKEVKK
jgi:hypothetical protein